MVTPDVVVAGGGVIGSTIAWRASESGLDVTLVDPDLHAAASWAAAGMLTPVTEAHYGEEALLQLNLTAARIYPDFVERLQDAAGAHVGYRRCGTIVVARDADDNAALDDLFSFHRRLGLDVTRLRPAEARAAEPHLSPRVRGGILVEGDHQVDNRALLEALRTAASRSGVRAIPQRVASVESRDGRVTGVVLDDGTAIAAGAVVLASGVWSGRVEGLPPLPALRPVKGQLLHLRGPSFLERNVRGLDVYIVPRSDGRVVVGATMEERGFDLRPTAEAAYELLRDAYELVPGILDLELVEHAVGLRPATPDNAPVIGRTELTGLIVATGHFRNGVLLAPATAEACVSLLAEEEPRVDVSAFTPDRYALT